MPSAVSARYGRDCRSRSPKAAPDWTWPGPAQGPACFLQPRRSTVLSRPWTVPTPPGDARGVAEPLEADRGQVDVSSAARLPCRLIGAALDPGQRRSRWATARCRAFTVRRHRASRRKPNFVHERRRRLLQPRPRLLGGNRARHDRVQVSPRDAATFEDDTDIQRVQQAVMPSRPGIGLVGSRVGPEERRRYPARCLAIGTQPGEMHDSGRVHQDAPPDKRDLRLLVDGRCGYQD